ncbi:hypothetical protein QUF81_12415 [Peribacillus simplex]|nr:hypothetical protein [Peribacillus simplex]MDM5293983.1 hypothetical protein [Peribacillus simplex]
MVFLSKLTERSFSRRMDMAIEAADDKKAITDGTERCKKHNLS